MRTMVRVYEDADGVLALVYDRSGTVENVVSGLEKAEPGLSNRFVEELMTGLPSSPQYEGIPFPVERVEMKAVNSCELIAEVRLVKTPDGREEPKLTLYPDAMGEYGEHLFGIARRHKPTVCNVIAFRQRSG